MEKSLLKNYILEFINQSIVQKDNSRCSMNKIYNYFIFLYDMDQTTITKKMFSPLFRNLYEKKYNITLSESRVLRNKITKLSARYLEHVALKPCSMLETIFDHVANDVNIKLMEHGNTTKHDYPLLVEENTQKPKTRSATCSRKTNKYVADNVNSTLLNMQHDDIKTRNNLLWNETLKSNMIERWLKSNVQLENNQIQISILLENFYNFYSNLNINPTYFNSGGRLTSKIIQTAKTIWPNNNIEKIKDTSKQKNSSAVYGLKIK